MGTPTVPDPCRSRYGGEDPDLAVEVSPGCNLSVYKAKIPLEMAVPPMVVRAARMQSVGTEVSQGNDQHEENQWALGQNPAGCA